MPRLFVEYTRGDNVTNMISDGLIEIWITRIGSDAVAGYSNLWLS
jgi:hypothetical protein